MHRSEPLSGGCVHRAAVQFACFMGVGREVLARLVGYELEK